MKRKRLPEKAIALIHYSSHQKSLLMSVSAKNSCCLHYFDFRGCFEFWAKICNHIEGWGKIHLFFTFNTWFSDHLLAEYHTFDRALNCTGVWWFLPKFGAILCRQLPKGLLCSHMFSHSDTASLTGFPIHSQLDWGQESVQAIWGPWFPCFLGTLVCGARDGLGHCHASRWSHQVSHSPNCQKSQLLTCWQSFLQWLTH